MSKVASPVSVCAACGERLVARRAVSAGTTSRTTSALAVKVVAKPSCTAFAKEIVPAYLHNRPAFMTFDARNNFDTENP